jgi:hypothetical protein
MTFPVFASGDVLNASDMNAVGLWLVKSQTIGIAVSSVTVTGAFSSDYDNYRIIVSGGVASTNNNLILTLGSTTTGYYRWVVYGNYNATTPLGGGGTNVSGWESSVYGTTDNLHGVMDLFGPNLAKTTQWVDTVVEARTTGLVGFQGGYLNNTTQYTAFTFTTNTGTITGGTIKVYGYRN